MLRRRLMDVCGKERVGGDGGIHKVKQAMPQRHSALSGLGTPLCPFISSSRTSIPRRSKDLSSRRYLLPAPLAHMDEQSNRGETVSQLNVEIQPAMSASSAAVSQCRCPSKSQGWSPEHKLESQALLSAPSQRHFIEDTLSPLIR